MSDSPIQTCERCQMKLHENLGTFTPSVRGSMAWRCAACLPIEGASGRLMREHIVMLRKTRFAADELERLAASRPAPAPAVVCEYLCSRCGDMHPLEIACPAPDEVPAPAPAVGEGLLEGIDLAGLPRYGVTWQLTTPTQPLLTPMPDGYWTPYHVAVSALAATQPTGEAERLAFRAGFMAVWHRDDSWTFDGPSAADKEPAAWAAWEAQNRPEARVDADVAAALAPRAPEPAAPVEPPPADMATVYGKRFDAIKSADERLEAMRGKMPDAEIDLAADARRKAQE